MKRAILTGIRVNEEPTIGNYLGAYLPMIRLAQEYAGEYEINMFVPDLHSFTTPINHSKLYDQIIKGVKYYIAAGLDVENPHIHVYRQSHVPSHCELTWILDCFTYFGEASRMTQFKEKSEEHKDSISVGLFNYPILMAADILLYDAKYIPLGEDQFQHLELARDLAMRFNNKFGKDVFSIPAPEMEQVKFMGLDKGLRIRSLTDPNKKMSKSSTNEKSKISMSDDPEEAKQKIMGATTDSIGKINFDIHEQIGISNLLQIESVISGVDLQNVVAKWAGETSYGKLKKQVGETVANFLQEFHAKLANISNEQVYDVLAKGEKYANEISNKKLLEVQKLVGLKK